MQARRSRAPISSVGISLRDGRRLSFLRPAAPNRNGHEGILLIWGAQRASAAASFVRDETGST